MNGSQITCDPVRIELFLQQQLGDDEQALFESHLDDCRECRDRLEAAAAEEDVWSGVRESLASEPLPPDWLTSSGDSVAAKDAEDAITHATVVSLLAPTDDDRMIGRLGTYEVAGIIGTGGMGVVLKAFDPALSRYVAIKVLAPHLASSGAARKRFSREAQAAAAVVHDNVMEIHGVANADALPYLVMPYVRGPSLQRRLDDEGPLEPVEILRIARQAASGLAAAHAQGLVHRDVKPANILLADGVERVKLTDFGLARTADDASLTKTGIIAGTPQYMSPEQARGEPVDPRSDLFSLGSVMYAMCTGRPPFRAETSYGVLRRITDEDPRPIREINPDIPDWLCRIIARLMAKDPSERFQSAEEVAELLERCLAHVQQPTAVPLPESCAVADQGQPDRASGRFLRKPWASTRRLILLAFISVLLLAGVVVTLELDKGTLTIESEADDVSVRITQGDTLVDQLTVTQAGKKLRIAAGTYVIEVEGEADGIAIENGAVTLKRGGTEIVRVVQRSAADAELLKFPVHRIADGETPHVVSPPSPVEVIRELERQEELEKNSLTDLYEKNPDHFRIVVEPVYDKTDPPRRLSGIGLVSLHRVRFQCAVSYPAGYLSETTKTFRIDADHLDILEAEDETVVADHDSVKVGELIPLVDAVGAFNDKYSDHPVGGDQPPLTDEEVISSIRWNVDVGRSAGLSEESLQHLREIAQKQLLDQSWRLDVVTELDGVDGERFRAWTIRLVRAQPDGTDETHIIRQRLLWQLNPAGLPMELASVDSALEENAIPLAAAINAFNRRHHTLEGQRQPPLTEEEVVAAIRWWKTRRNEAPVTNEEFELFQWIAESRHLPEGAEFEVLGHFRPSDQSDFHIWSVRIVMRRTSMPGVTYAYIIRKQHIRSRTSDDGGVTWGTPVNGLRAGLRFEPQNEEYALGQHVTPTFYFQNMGDRELDASFPRIMTHGYYEDVVAVDPAGRPIVVDQDRGPRGPVGWGRHRLPPGGQTRIRGMPIVLGDVDRGAAEAAIRAKPGQSVRVRYVLPNYTERAGEPLQTGEVAFSMSQEGAASRIGKSATPEAETLNAEVLASIATNAWRNSTSGVDEGALSHPVPFEVGATYFRDGDRITIEEVRGTAETIEVGNMYEIRGTYRLASRDRATLLASITEDGGERGAPPVSFPHLRTQSTSVERGEGRFALMLYMWQEGKPHVSFYPEIRSEGFGHVYFGTGDSVLKKGRWEQAPAGETSNQDAVIPTSKPTERETIRNLRGTWNLVSLTSNGKTPSGAPDQGELTFEDHRYHLVLNKPGADELQKGHSGSFSINPATEPAEINLFAENFLIQAFYKLDGEELTLAFFGRSEVGRPRSFDDVHPDGQPRIILTFRRLD